MKKIKVLLAVFIAIFCASPSQARVEKVFNSSATGTTSATVFVPKGSGVAEVKGLAWRIDSGVTTAFVGEYIGQKQYAITSATAANASVLWITNTSTTVGVGSFIIFYDDSAATYYLRRVSAATTTSVTVQTAINIATTTSDVLWLTGSVVSMPVGDPARTAGGFPGLWLPAEVPTALVIDGNTTSCAISISGSRGDRQ